MRQVGAATFSRAELRYVFTTTSVDTLVSARDGTARTMSNVVRGEAELDSQSSHRSLERSNSKASHGMRVRMTCSGYIVLLHTARHGSIMQRHFQPSIGLIEPLASLATDVVRLFGLAMQ